MRTMSIAIWVLASMASLTARADDQCVAVYTRGSELWIRRADRSTRVLTDSLGVNSPRWSPDGTRIVYAHDWRNTRGSLAELVVADVESSSRLVLPALTLEDGAKSLVNLGWHSDNAVWIEGHVNPSTNVYYEWNLRTKERTEALGGVGFAWSPDGKHLAHQEHRIHGAKGAREPVVRVDGEPVAGSLGSGIRSGLIWSPDGRWLGLVTQSGGDAFVRVIDPARRVVAASSVIELTPVTDLEWISNDELVAGTGRIRQFKVSGANLSEQKLSAGSAHFRKPVVTVAGAEPIAVADMFCK